MLSRLIDTLLVMLGVSTLVFLLLAWVPGDPVDVLLGESAQAGDHAAMRATLGLDRPLVQRWADFHVHLMQGDLGSSLFHKRPVAELIGERLPATLYLALAAFMVILGLALPLGILAAHHHGRWPDRLASLIALIGISIPNFWLGPLLVLLFSIGFGLTPVSGMHGPASIVLPALTLGLSMAAIATRMLRSSLLEVVSRDFVRTARSKGLGDIAVIGRHVLPNAMLPVLTLLGLQLGGLLAGTVITEVVFAWPGVGSLMVDAIRQRDYPVVQGVVLVIAVSYVLLNLATDLLSRRLDPRLRGE